VPTIGLPDTADASIFPAAKVQTIPELIATKALAQGVNPTLAAKIAFCESSNRQFDEDGQPLRGLHNPGDIGLFQINERFHLTKSRALGYDIYQTEGNIDYALYLITEEGTRHWNYSRACWG